MGTEKLEKVKSFSRGLIEWRGVKMGCWDSRYGCMKNNGAGFVRTQMSLTIKGPKQSHKVKNKVARTRSKIWNQLLWWKNRDWKKQTLVNIKSYCYFLGVVVCVFLCVYMWWGLSPVGVAVGMYISWHSDGSRRIFWVSVVAFHLVWHRTHQHGLHQSILAKKFRACSCLCLLSLRERSGMADGCAVSSFGVDSVLDVGLHTRPCLCLTL